nr:hypothetical protein [Infirmifilum uzonense]
MQHLCRRLLLGRSSCTCIASLRAYADILPDYSKALDSMDAMLRELEEQRSMLEGLLEEQEDHPPTP